MLPLSARRRDTMLERLVDALAADDRVVACWLGGSLGRGTADEVSDLDLHTVVRDESYLEWWDGRADTLATAGRVLLAGPPIDRGSTDLDRFQGVVFEGGYVLDWTVTALSEAERDLDTRVLFERSVIACHPVALVPDTVQDRLEGALWAFWWMTLVALKQCDRGATDRAVAALEFVRNHAVSLWRLLADPARADEAGVHWLHPERDAELRTLVPTFGPDITPRDCARVTREVMALVQSLHPRLAERGVPVPYEAAAESYRQLEHVESSGS